MSALSLRDIEEALRQADPQKRHHTLRAVADLFLSDAPSLDEARVEMFDNVFEFLLDDSQRSDLADLSQRMAPVDNAPRRLINRLANDADISIAGPVLAQSPRLSTDDLCEIARTKGNAHMLAISVRKDLAEPVTDILVEEGDQQVARSVAGNCSARLSLTGIEKLIERAGSDQSISASLSARPEIPGDLLKAALAKVAARAEQISRAIAAATRLALSLKQTNGLPEEQIAAFANQGEYENLVAAIAVRTGLRYEVVENLLHPNRISGIVLVCKSLGASWTTADAVLRLAKKRNNIPETEINHAHREFVELSRLTAERIVRFWHLRQAVSPNS